MATNWYQWIIDNVPANKRDAFIYAMTNYVSPGQPIPTTLRPGDPTIAMANLQQLERDNPQRFTEYTSGDFTYLPVAPPNATDTMNNWAQVGQMAQSVGASGGTTVGAASTPTATISAPNPNATYTPMVVHLTPEMLPDEVITDIFDSAKKYTPVGGLYDGMGTFDSSNPEHRKLLWTAIDTMQANDYAGYNALLKQYYNSALSAPDYDTYISPQFGAVAVSAGGTSHSSNATADIQAAEQAAASGGYNGRTSGYGQSTPAITREALFQRVIHTTGLRPENLGTPEKIQNPDGTTTIVFKNEQQLAWYTGVVTEKLKSEIESGAAVPYWGTLDPGKVSQERVAQQQAANSRASLQDLMGNPSTQFKIGDLVVNRNQ